MVFIPSHQAAWLRQKSPFHSNRSRFLDFAAGISVYRNLMNSHEPKLPKAIQIDHEIDSDRAATLFRIAKLQEQRDRIQEQIDRLTETLRVLSDDGPLKVPDA